MSSADFNPYASPQSPGMAIPPLPPLSYDGALFRRRVRIAVSCLAPLAIVNWWLIQQFAADSRTSLLLLLNIFWLVPVLLIAFFLGDRILIGLGTVLHILLGGNVPRPVWLAVGRAALWMLPWVGFLGGLVWAVFLLGLLLRVPVVFVLCPIAGNIIAAWCYVSLAHRWWKTRRHFATSPG